MLATPELLGEPPILWLKRAGEIGAAVSSDFFALPFTTKRDMREGFPHNFLLAGRSLDALLAEGLVELEHTSGTSEERVPVLLGRGWWNAQEERALRLNSFVARVLDKHPGSRRIILTTPLCNGTTCHSRWASLAQRTVDTALAVNQSRIPFLLKDAELERMARETAAWAPHFLDLDPVHGAWFALFCERRGIRFPSLRFVLCSYEFVSVVHRRILERVFGLPVLNLYGATETGHLLMQDSRGAMQPCHDNAFLEMVEPDTCGVGQLVVTTLTNDFTPLVRYRIGDLVQRQPEAPSSSFIVHGRVRDALQTGKRSRVTTWQVDQCFTGLGGIAHYQLRLTENGGCRLRFVPDGAGPRPEEVRQLTARLEELLQVPGSLVIEKVDVLVPSPSGKFRLTCRA